MTSLSRRLSSRLGLVLLVLTGAAASGGAAGTPPLLAEAIQRWTAGKGDWAFTQETRTFLADGQVKQERLERYDPSLPDSQRWRLIEVNGLPASPEERRKWETRKNGKTRKKIDEDPYEYLDLQHAVQIGETPKNVRFKVRVRPEAERLLAVEEIDVVITVDKQSGNISGVGAALREPMRVLLGLAQITDLEVDLRINPVDEGPASTTDQLQPGSNARATISKLGRPVEYNWRDFKRVTLFGAP